MALVGVDGCRGGWIAARRDDGDGQVSWQHATSFRALYDDKDVDVIAVDIPIGLPDVGVRQCDREARRLLGTRRASVFAAPIRPVLGCSTYAEARAVLAELGGASMSAQAFGIVRAVVDVDACVTPHDDDRVVETHPELAFLALARSIGRPPPAYGKKTAAGHAERLALLSVVFRDAAAYVASAPRPAAVDDAADALACLWVAERWAVGDRSSLGDGRRNSRGLPMRIAPDPAAPGGGNVR
ncbi:MAG: DUF429 domain-containing protein [Frankiales bacterium]|nr:DUF429 domain-containing protein [Frankiales bacterium]